MMERSRSDQDIISILQNRIDDVSSRLDILSSRGSGGGGGEQLIFDAQVARGNVGDPISGAAVIDTNAILGGNIPSIYKKIIFDYQIRMASSNNTLLCARLNNDGSAIYDYVYTAINNAALTPGGAGGATEIVVNNVPGPTGPANTWATGTLMFDNYNYTDRHKLFRGSGTFSVILGAYYETRNGGGYRSLPAMTRLHFFLSGGFVFADGCRVSAWGVA